MTHVRVPVAEAELAAYAMWTAGATAVEERDNGDGTITVIADATPDGPWPWELVAVIDDGLDGWRPWARARRASSQSRLVVQPPWVGPVADARDDDLTLIIEPGQSFGSGSHATTRLVLAELEQRIEPGWSVLDVGCGSGVLAIAAAILGAAHVVAVDIERDAVVTTVANAQRNGVVDRVSASNLPVGELVPEFDLVLANITASTVAELAQVLTRRTTPDGVLIASGFLEADRQQVMAAFPGSRCLADRIEEGWLLLTLGHPAVP